MTTTSHPAPWRREAIQIALLVATFILLFLL